MIAAPLFGVAAICNTHTSCCLLHSTPSSLEARALSVRQYSWPGLGKARHAALHDSNWVRNWACVGGAKRGIGDEGIKMQSKQRPRRRVFVFFFLLVVVFHTNAI